MEIERKFLVRCFPENVGGLPSQTIQQGYLPMATTPDALEIRIRRKGDACFLTIKHGQGLCRSEVELPLPAPDFNLLWPLTKGQRLEKTRHLYPWQNWRVELDVYGGQLAGLQIAEVEFPNLEASTAFHAPDFFGVEVTDDPGYRNANLARDGWPPSSER